jgi:hypothetical protein
MNAPEWHAKPWRLKILSRTVIWNLAVATIIVAPLSLKSF